MAKYLFIGKDGSMGYKHGKVYRGNIYDVRYDGSILFATGIFPFNLNKPIIPYSSMETFKANWQEV